jgi:uncharacterized protein YqeY
MLNIDELIKNSLKAQDTVSLRVYRNLKTDITAFKTQKNAPVYDEAAELKLIQKYSAKMEDAEKQYSQAGREDLATECREDLEVLKKLLPEPVNPDEIHHFVYDYCVENDFHNNDTLVLPRKFMGIAIKAVKEAFPTADGKMISEIVKTYVE